jgi:hypothetical protein
VAALERDTAREAPERSGGHSGGLEERSEKFMELLTREQGKPRADAEWEIGGSIIWCRELAKLFLEEEVIVETAEGRVITRFTPVGVVGAITPWNFPVLLAIWKIDSGSKASSRESFSACETRGSELCPGDDLLNRRKGIGLCRLRRDQRRTDRGLSTFTR